MNTFFNDKVALVTGAGSGIGLATARAFADAGAAVALIDVHENAVRSATEELSSAGYRAIAANCNVAHETEVAANCTCPERGQYLHIDSLHLSFANLNAF